MSDIKLFRLSPGVAVELQGDGSDLKKPLQTLIGSGVERQVSAKAVVQMPRLNGCSQSVAAVRSDPLTGCS